MTSTPSQDPLSDWCYRKEGEPRNYCYCKFCNHHVTAGVTRLKHHLAGTKNGVKKCEMVPPNVKKHCMDALKAIEMTKLKKAALTREIGRMGEPQEENEEIPSVQASNSSRPLSSFFNVEVPQTTIENRFKKEHRELVVRKIGRCIYANGLSFNLLNSPYWIEMITEVGNYGRGLKQPSAYEIRTRVLKEEVTSMNAIKATHKASWEKYGCTLMSDGWTDGKSRSLINFLINSPEGTFFYKSIDASDAIKSGDYLWECLDKMVEEIGENNVLQVITDNHASYVNAGKKLMESRKTLFWTPCAAHCIDLMLEDLGKMKIHKEILASSKCVV